MPGESGITNTERVQELYDSFAQGDIEAIRDLMHPEVVLHEPKGIVGGGSHHGFDAIAENVFDKAKVEWEDVTVVPDRFVEDGDTVVALLDWSGTYRETGKSVEYPNAHVFDFVDGKIARWTSYADTAEFNAALEA